MSLLIDLFGYLSVVIHGLTIVAQSMALGGVLFAAILARPLAPTLGASGAAIRERTERLARLSALALVACEAATIALQGAVLVGTVDLSWSSVLGAEFALAGLIKITGALVIALTVGRLKALPLAAAAVVLAAATFTTHANARLDDRLPLLAVEALHQLGAAIWIGGIPSFLIALDQCRDGLQWRRVGRRFSQ